MLNRTKAYRLASLLVCACTILVSCNPTAAPSPTALIITPTKVIPTAESTLTPTLIPTATSTPEPLAARVNGEWITLAEYQLELARFHRAQTEVPGTNLATEELTDEMIVLNDLIDETLLAQGALDQGFVLDDPQVEERYTQLATQIDLQAWMFDQGYTEESFRKALRRSILAAWMRDMIVDAVPVALEQVHARQILLYNLEEANQVYANLQSGADFSRLAALYDPVAAGDLGWFPRGYLVELAIEQAIFDLQPNAYSPVIETQHGFHIIQVIERDPQRKMESDVRRLLQTRELQAWLRERRETSNIEVLIP